MSADDPFSLRLNPLKLRSRSKDTSKAAVARSDAAGEKHGFEERAPKKNVAAKPARAPARCMPRSCPMSPGKSLRRRAGAVCNRGFDRRSLGALQG